MNFRWTIIVHPFQTYTSFWIFGFSITYGHFHTAAIEPSVKTAQNSPSQRQAFEVLWSTITNGTNK